MRICGCDLFKIAQGLLGGAAIGAINGALAATTLKVQAVAGIVFGASSGAAALGVIYPINAVEAIPGWLLSLFCINSISMGVLMGAVLLPVDEFNAISTQSWVLLAWRVSALGFSELLVYDSMPSCCRNDRLNEEQQVQLLQEV